MCLWIRISRNPYLYKNPVPFNFEEMKRIDEYMVQLLKEKNRKALLNQDNL